jgi:hypothetical protein
MFYDIRPAKFDTSSVSTFDILELVPAWVESCFVVNAACVARTNTASSPWLPSSLEFFSHSDSFDSAFLQPAKAVLSQPTGRRTVTTVARPRSQIWQYPNNAHNDTHSCHPLTHGHPEPDLTNAAPPACTNPRLHHPLRASPRRRRRSIPSAPGTNPLTRRVPELLVGPLLLHLLPS